MSNSVECELTVEMLNNTIFKLSTDDEQYTIVVVFLNSEISICMFEHSTENTYKSKVINSVAVSKHPRIQHLKMYELHSILLKCLNRNQHYSVSVIKKINGVDLCFRLKTMKIILNISCMFYKKCTYDQFTKDCKSYWKYFEPNNSSVFRQHEVQQEINEERPKEEKETQTIITSSSSLPKQKQIIERRITRSMTKRARLLE